MIGIGILGCGRIGQVHARTLKHLNNAKVVGVSDAMPDAAASLATQLGCAAYDSADLITHNDVDAIVIGTPTDTHFDLVHQAAAAGKAIFCEKPIDLSADRIRTCLAAVEKAGVSFMTAFNRRFDPNFAHLKHQIDQGMIGDVELLTILSRDPAPPPIGYVKSSGGIFRDMMIHDLDMARFILGEEPASIFASGSCLVDPAIGEAGDVDTAAVTLTTASGKICQISNSRRASYGYDQRIEVHGSKGMLRADNVFESTVEIATEAGFSKSPVQHFFLERYEAAYAAEMTAFIDALNSGDTPTPSGDDGLKAQLLADAAALSLAEGRVVTL